MKKILFLMVSAFVLCTSLVFATNSQESSSVNSENIPEDVKCEFTLNHYTGMVSGGSPCLTRDIKVQINCPMDKAVTVNVYVWVGDELVASQPFTINAKKSSSEESSIVVPREYKGMKYKLTVN